MSDFKITINSFPGSSFSLAHWNLVGGDEAERICVKKDDKEYCFVFENEGLKLEVWSLDVNGELNELETTLYPIGFGENQNIFN